MSRRLKTSKHKDRTRIKIILVFSLFIAAWLGLWARAFFIQYVQGEELAQMASRQYYSQEKITGRRGEIFDRNGNVLAQSVRVKSVHANPFLIKEPVKTARILAETLDLDYGRVKRSLDKQSGFAWIKRKISDARARKVAEQNMPGIYIIDEYTRVYPQGHMLGQVLGFVGMDNQGLEGLERSLNDTLSGKDMMVVRQRDASGHTMTLLPMNSQEADGQDVILTIDSDLQFAAEKALARSVDEYGGKYGVSLVVHVPTGDILAWATYPYFNPNNFRSSSAQVWRNRAAVDLVEPGSTLKPFLIASALEEGVVEPDSLYFCEEGRWRVGRYHIKDVKEYGWLTTNRVLRYSSNICSAKIGKDLGPGAYHRYLHDLGLKTSTSLPLPGQGRGIMRPAHVWSEMDLAAISFGQGVSSTPIQLARAYLTLGRMGRFSQLRLIRDAEKTSQGKQVFSPEVSRTVLGMLRDAVQMDGTGTRARLTAVETGGKTGTAQKTSPNGGYGNEYVASFVGFIPAMDPKYLVMVLIDEPSPQHYGGVVAAPVFADIGSSIVSWDRELEFSLASTSEADQATGIEPAGDQRFSISRAPADNPAQSKNVPDFRGSSLRQAVERLLSKGIVPEIQGQGVRVSDQQPRPGQSWDEMGKVVLHLGES
ncbi:MAG: penicillin-binding transpeptidase domain-containing protein [Desulfonatronovibrionaceae bacterium]